ncbi:hypothetical protein LTR10_005811 [Elasticomyces elasticus]|nr:hypothetical protein LTR10_005811 [Elasticomyces elasticus]KAK4965018.1 hypothetical protein LTR42_012436 [Elasticomyces elasticus]
MAATEVIDIAPQGDVLLLCGEKVGNGKVVGLRVSSHIMSLASPVFKALLAPQFKEGAMLAAKATVDIPMPDDNAADMHLMCDIFHMRHDKVPRSLAVNRIICSTELCDKYDCAIAMQPTFEAWDICLQWSLGLGDLAHLLIAATMLNYEALQARIGVKLLLKADKPISTIVMPEEAKLEEICAELDKTRQSLLEGLSGTLEDVVDVLVEANEEVACDCNFNCPVQVTRLKTVLVGLRSAKLWPTNARSSILLESIERMEEFYVCDPKDLYPCDVNNCIKAYEMEEEGDDMQDEEVELGPRRLETLSTKIGTAGQELRAKIEELSPAVAYHES